MVLMVPDIDLEDVLAGDDSDPKAELDTEELTSNLPKDQQKVELDLEDAPFLEEEDEEEEEEEEQEETPLEEPGPSDDGEPAWYRRKKIVIPAAAGLVLILAVAAWFLLRPSGEAPPAAQVPEAPQTVEGEQAPPPPPEPEPEVQDFMVTLDPFWVEQRGEDGAVRFLVCQFTTVTQDEKLSFEVSQKTTILRDAVYYYLKNKDLTYLSDKTNVEALKSDLLSVMNQYLAGGRLETILVDQYLVK